MSGIVAVVRRDGAPVERGLVQRLTDLLAFRGPDGVDVWSDGSVGFGHALLECRDEGPSDQQPCSLDGQVWITADARLDARNDLIRRLGGENNAERTDAELILAAYRTWGEKCVEHLLGDFAFIIWDGRARRLFCARDHFGVKPFYFALTNDSLILGNTIQCLRGHPDVSARLNDQAVADFLLFGSNQDPGTTIFNDIQRLSPAHVLCWREGGAPIVRRYWNLPAHLCVEFMRPAECIERFREVLCTVVGDRIRTRRVGVCMSGGLDSTSVAAMAKEVLLARGGTFDLRAYTIVYDRLIPDQERRYSALAADYLGLHIDQLQADDYLPFTGMDQWRTPEPSTRQLSVCTLDLYKQAASRCRVVLTGDGGDPLLFPDPLHLVGLLGQGRCFQWFREVAQYVLTRGKLPPFGFRNALRRWRGRERVVPPLPDWLDPSFAQRAGIEERWKELNNPQSEEHVEHPVAHRILQSPLWTNLFESYDAGTTGVAVEFPHPFFDLRLIDFVFARPSFPWCIDKDLMRTAMRGFLPEVVRKRRKALLAGDPLHELLRHESWRGRECLTELSGVSEYATVDKLVDSLRRYAHSGGNDDYPAVHALCLDDWLRSITTFDPYHSLSQEPYHAAV